MNFLVSFFNMSVFFSLQGDCQLHGQFFVDDEMKSRERERDDRDKQKLQEKNKSRISKKYIFSLPSERVKEQRRER